MWEGKDEPAAQPAEPEPVPEATTASEENEFNDDDDFGDDFDDFAEGQEAEDDFGDFDDADETPIAPEPQPQIQTQQPDFLAGLVSSVQSNIDSLAVVPDHCFSAVVGFYHTFGS